MLNQPGGFSSTTGSGGSTAVDATLKASTASVGIVAQGSAASSAAPWFVGVTNPTTSVTVSSGTVALASAASTNPVAAVTVANPTTSVTVSSGVVLGAGSTANNIGAVSVSS